MSKLSLHIEMYCPDIESFRVELLPVMYQKECKSISVSKKVYTSLSCINSLFKKTSSVDMFCKWYEYYSIAKKELDKEIVEHIDYVLFNLEIENGKPLK